MKQDLFNKLPSEIVIDILSRLSVRSILCCKCVCKPWLRLLETNEFVKTHLSKSVPRLLLRDFKNPSNQHKVFTLEDEYNPCREVIEPETKYKLPNYGRIYGSSDGLLFLRKAPALYICNPITRDYIELHFPQETGRSPYRVAYGFGKSETIGQHKVVRISQDYVKSTGWFSIIECQVYTLGTGSWRTISPPPALLFHDDPPTFLNGNLHWLMIDSSRTEWISCFNLETELFSTFCVPINPTDGGHFRDVYAIGNYLCLKAYEREEEEDGVFIWMMKDYGDENSWRKEFISKWYSLEISGLVPIHTPSFLYLKSFATEKVHSY